MQNTHCIKDYTAWRLFGAHAMGSAKTWNRHRSIESRANSIDIINVPSPNRAKGRICGQGTHLQCRNQFRHQGGHHALLLLKALNALQELVILFAQHLCLVVVCCQRCNSPRQASTRDTPYSLGCNRINSQTMGSTTVPYPCHSVVPKFVTHPNLPGRCVET